MLAAFNWRPPSILRQTLSPASVVRVKKGVYHHDSWRLACRDMCDNMERFFYQAWKEGGLPLPHGAGPALSRVRSTGPKGHPSSAWDADQQPSRGHRHKHADQVQVQTEEWKYCNACVLVECLWQGLQGFAACVLRLCLVHVSLCVCACYQKLAASVLAGCQHGSTGALGKGPSA